MAKQRKSIEPELPKLKKRKIQKSEASKNKGKKLNGEMKIKLKSIKPEPQNSKPPKLKKRKVQKLDPSKNEGKKLKGGMTKKLKSIKPEPQDSQPPKLKKRKVQKGKKLNGEMTKKRKYIEPKLPKSEPKLKKRKVKKPEASKNKGKTLKGEMTKKRKSIKPEPQNSEPPKLKKRKVKTPEASKNKGKKLKGGIAKKLKSIKPELPESEPPKLKKRKGKKGKKLKGETTKKRKLNQQEPKSEPNEPIDSKNEEFVEPEFFNHSDVRKCWNFQSEFLMRKETLFSFRSMNGPFLYFPFSAEIIKNRQLTERIRMILLTIHENTLEFLGNRLKSLIAGKEARDNDLLLKVLREMCSSVFRIEKNQNWIEFPSDPLCSAVESALNGTSAALRHKHFSEFYRNGQILFPNTPRLLREDVCTRLLTFFCHSGKDCLRLIAESDGQGGLHRRKPRIKRSAFTFYTNFDALYKFNRERGAPVSVWCSIPANSVPLLEYVFDYGLLKLLPSPLLQYVATWMMGVRDRMGVHLESGEFQNFARQFKIGTVLEQNDARIKRFVMETGRSVLNSHNFSIFDKNVEEFAWQMLQDKYLHIKRSGALRYVDRLSARVVGTLDPLLGKCHPKIHYHCLAQILRFVTTFVCHTIRCVFIFDRKLSKYKYDGSFEHGIIDDSICDTKDVLLPPIDHDFYNNSEEASEFCNYPPVFFDPREPSSSFAPNFATNSVITMPSAPVPVVEPSYQEQKPVVVPKKEPDMSPDVTEEELAHARALRTPSEVSGSILNRVVGDDDDDDDEEEVPKKWRRAYKVLLETNADLKAKVEAIKKRYEALL